MAQADQDTQDWTGRAVHGRDGSRLGKLTEVFPDGAGGRGGRWGAVRSRFGRRTLVPLDGASTDGPATVRLPVDGRTLRAAPAAPAGAPDADTETRLQRHYTGRGVLADAHARQRARFGGTKLGAAFFGWLVAIGLTALLAAVAGLLAAAAGLPATIPPGLSGTDVMGAGVAGGIAVLAILMIAYFGGGYVAGRLARFDGTRNGIATWLIGLVVTVVAAVLAAVAGSRYAVLGAVQLPAPVSVEQSTLVGVVVAGVLLLGTFVAAALGGRVGERFHHRVDRVATDAL